MVPKYRAICGGDSAPVLHLHLLGYILVATNSRLDDFLGKSWNTSLLQNSRGALVAPYRYIVRNHLFSNLPKSVKGLIICICHVSCQKPANGPTLDARRVGQCAGDVCNVSIKGE